MGALQGRRASRVRAPVVALTIVASALRGCGGEPTAAGGTVRRVVTISPGLTEIAFALGRGDAVVGADSFSRYPAAAARLPRVGGLVDPSFERILALDSSTRSGRSARIRSKLGSSSPPTRGSRAAAAG